MDPAAILVLVLSSLIIVPIVAYSVLARSEQGKNTEVDFKNKQSGNADETMDVPSHKIDATYKTQRNIVDMSLFVISAINTDTYPAIKSIRESASNDFLHLILHLATVTGGVNSEVSKLINAIFDWYQSPDDWERYIEKESVSTPSFAYAIPLTLKALYHFESCTPREHTLNNKSCIIYIETVKTLIKTIKEIYGTNNQALNRESDILYSNYKFYIANGYAQESIHLTQANSFLAQSAAINEKEQGYAPNAESYAPSNTYLVCPHCLMVIHDSVTTCPFCEVSLTAEERQNAKKYTPIAEKNYYNLETKQSDIKLLFTRETSGRWLDQYWNRSEGKKDLKTYYDTSFFYNNNRYQISGDVYPNTYYSIGHFLYSPEKLCQGDAIPSNAFFSSECFLNDTYSITTDKYVFQLDGTVTYFMYDKLSKQGTYTREDNLLILKLEDLFTKEVTVKFLAVCENRLCLGAYVDSEGYQKYIANRTSQATTEN